MPRRSDGPDDPSLPWITATLVRATGAERLARRLWADPAVAGRRSPFLYLYGLVLLDQGLLSGVRYVTAGYYHLADNPLWLLIPVGMTAVVLGTVRVLSKYDDVLDGLTGSSTGDDPEQSTDRIVPARWSVAIWALLAVGYWAWFALLAPEGLDAQIAAKGGPVIGRVKWWLFIPLGYGSLIADFLASILAATVALPRRIEALDPDLSFSPETVAGGLGPAGDLVSYSALFYFVGLFAYTLSVFGFALLPGEGPWPDPGPTVLGVFAVAWLGGFVLFLYPLRRLRDRVARAKRQRLRELYAAATREPDLRTVGAVDRRVRHQTELLYLQRTGVYPTSLRRVVSVVSVALTSLLQVAVTLVVGSALPVPA